MTLARDLERPIGRLKSIDEAPFVDIFSSEFIEHPLSVISPLQRETGLIQTPVGGVVIRRHLVQELLADRRLRSSLLDTIRMQGVSEGVVFDLVSSWLYGVDGDEHLRLRSLVHRPFSVRAADAQRPLMRDILQSLVAPVVARGRCEFMADVADHYPIQVMCHLLGVPDDDHDRFTAWNKAATWVLSFELGSHREEAEWGVAELSRYVGQLIESRRDDPRDDLVTALIQAEAEGDRLSNRELHSMVLGLLFSGFETTRNQLGLAMALFAEHPEQWTLLAAHPELVPRAVDEVMRARGAVGVAPRIAVEPLEVDGFLVPAGTLLVLSTASANHDPAAYDDPHVFDITMERESHLTFGGGPHFCLGANLARAEMQEALTLLSVQMPELGFDGPPRWRSPLGIVGPEVLPLRFGPSAPAAPPPR